ncbi:amidohydrolase [Streptomyces sp. NRRL F-5755]|uniref:amidohydrolase n=1 Tax=Streptomyces sp. NRRL F-5755 TaxID=1519475 RepID=UPI0006B0651B|nr:amidohydrolase [Streptomyces sp. NRRL F-5755]KOU02365.1 amidohydrolase [Streptomyces sp. NRRL F-5755]
MRNESASSTARLPDDAARILPSARRLYEELHAHPELSGQEKVTAALFAARLTDVGCDVTSGVGGHGVVGLLLNGDGPLVALRAELDGLPVAEATGLPYASTRTVTGADGRAVPVAHACGHDAHLACAWGAAMLLAGQRDAWSGTLMVIGQPAEETLTGARDMLADGLYERFGRPDVVLAQHVAPLPCGVLAHGPGPLTSAAALVNVVVRGRGGHGATPHLTVDPVVVAANIIQRIQSVVSRENNPFEPLVVTVGSLHAGTVPNVIPDRAELGISIRCYANTQLDRAVAAVCRIVRAECQAAGCPEEPDITVGPNAPVNINDRAYAASVRSAHTALLGERRVLTTPAMLASEDFGLFARDGVGTVYWFLGSVAATDWGNAPGTALQEKVAGLPANHAPDFAPSVEATLQHGITAAAAAALACFAH